LVDDGGVERGKVDLCGRLVVVSHRLADDGDWDVAGLGCAAPTVATNVGGEFDGCLCHKQITIGLCILDGLAATTGTTVGELHGVEALV
jgi:hypothetical protein